MTPEQIYKLYFGNEPVPDHAYEFIKYIDDTFYKISQELQVRTIPLSNIVGTNQEEYGLRGFRWIDMLTNLEKIKTSRYRPETIKLEGLLTLSFIEKTSEGLTPFELINIEGTDEYYIFCEGHHRISFRKLSGKKFVEVFVRTAKPQVKESRFN